MSLRFVDGMSHYSTSQMTRKWTTKNGTITINSATGRGGRNSIRTGGANVYVSKTIDSQASWVVGFAFKYGSTPVTNIAIAQFLDAGSNQVELLLKTDGTLTMQRNGNTLTGGTSSTVLSSGVFYYIEWKVTIASSISASTCKVRVNGVDVITVATGQNTKNTANATANQLLIGLNTGTNVTCDFCDLYLCDGQGSVNNDFLGDMVVETIYPNGNGNTSNFVNDGSNSTNNYSHVNETPADDDTSYVQSSTPTDKDTYAFADLASIPASISGIQIVVTGEKTDAGTRTIVPVIRSGGTDYDQTSYTLTSGYTCDLNIVEQDPNTSAAWIGSGVNSAQFGYKLTA